MPEYKDIISKINVLKQLDIPESLILEKIPEYKVIKPLMERGINEDNLVRILSNTDKPQLPRLTKKSQDIPPMNKGDQYLGIDSKSNKACLITKTSDFKFTYSAFDWGGSSTIETILNHEHVKPVGERINLTNPETYEGVDHDMGHQYPFKFTFDQVQKLERVKY